MHMAASTSDGQWTPSTRREMATKPVHSTASAIALLPARGQIRATHSAAAVANPAVLRVCPLGKLDPQYHCASHNPGRARPTMAFMPQTTSVAVITDAAMSTASKRRRATSSATAARAERGIRNLAEPLSVTTRWCLFAFEHAHDDAGRPDPDHSTFHVPDTYAAQVARQHADRFDRVASIHPYRDDALQRLDAALAAGARALKWLPSAMNIDLRDPRCRPLYERLARAGRPLIVHCGEEKAVPGAGRDELGNPLHVRHLLAHGVRVVMAHCGSLGHATDEDLKSRPEVPSFDLFERVMDERAHAGRLLGDISAVFRRNRSDVVWRTVLQRDDWHGRLLHGSDHPLPGVMPLFSLPKLQRAGLLAEADIGVLSRVREHNPLLFDLVLKRRLRAGSAQLPAGVFKGRALASAVQPV